jgi:predicted Zn-dependent protease
VGARLAPLLLVMLTVLLHAPVLEHPLLEDDLAYVGDNSAVSTARNSNYELMKLFAQDALSAVHPDGPLGPDLAAQALYRPLTLAIWAVTMHAGGPGTPGWPLHLLSIVAHAAMVVLLWRLGARIFGRPWLATVAAALFAVHPLPVAAVAHASAVGTVLAAVAIFLGLNFWRSATANPEKMAIHPFEGLLLALALGLLCHESALLLLPAVALLDWLLPPKPIPPKPAPTLQSLLPEPTEPMLVVTMVMPGADLPGPGPLAISARPDLPARKSKSGKSAKKGQPATKKKAPAKGQGKAKPGAEAVMPDDGSVVRIAPYAGMLIVIALMVLLRRFALGRLLPQPADFDPILNPLAEESWSVRLFNVPALVALPARLLVLPLQLSADYSLNALPIARSALALAPLVGTLLMAALLGAGLWLRKRSPPASFGLLGFLGVTLLGAGLLPLGTMFTEERAYLPAAFGCLALAAGIDALCRRLNLAQHPRRALAVLPLLLGLCGALAWRTAQRENDWRSPEALWESAKAVVPESARVHERLGSIRAAEQRYADAAAEYEASLQIAADSLPPALGLADALAALGQPGKALDTCNRMVERREQAASRATGDNRSEQGLLRVALTRRAKAHVGLRDNRSAEADLMAASALPGSGVEPEMRLARMLIHSGRITQAIPVLRDALATEPDNPEALYDLARADLAAGDEEGARRVLEHLQLTPRGRALKLVLDATVMHDQAVAAGDEPARQRALQMFEEARALDASLPEPWIMHGRQLVDAARYDEALPVLLAATDRTPGEATAWLLLARTQNALDQPEDALASAQHLALLDAGLDTLGVMAEAYLRLGKLDDVTRVSGQIDELGGDAVEVMLARISSLHFGDRLDGALSAIQLAREVPRYGSDPRLLRALAEVQLDAGRPQDALAALDDEAALPGAARDDVLPFNRARALTLLHREMEAAAELEQIERKTPADSPLRPLLLQRRAELFLSEQGPFWNPQEASKLCAEALLASTLRKTSEQWELMETSIVAAVAAGDLNAALARAQDAAARFPGVPRWSGAADALQLARDGNLAGALDSLQQSPDVGLRRIGERWLTVTRR